MNATGLDILFFLQFSANRKNHIKQIDFLIAF